MFAPWYTPRPSDCLVARLLTERADDGVRACIITGAPGVGKTSFARALAEGAGGREVKFHASVSVAPLKHLAHHRVQFISPVSTLTKRGPIEKTRARYYYSTGRVLFR